MADIDYAKEARNAERIAVHTGGDLARYARMAAAVFEERVNTLGDQSAYGQHLRSVLDRIIAAGEKETAGASKEPVRESGSEKVVGAPDSPPPVSDRAIDEVARFVGIPPLAVRRFLGAFKLAGVSLRADAGGSADVG